jgi:hypothetical protein
MKLIKVLLLLPLFLINFTLADAKYIKEEVNKEKVISLNNNTSSLKKIVLFEADSTIGKQIATTLLGKKNLELHFTFLSEKNAKSFSSYTKRKFSKRKNIKFSSYLYNPSYQNNSFPKSFLSDAIVILPISDNSFFVNPQEYTGHTKNFLLFGFVAGALIANSEANKHNQDLNVKRHNMKNANWDIQKSLLDKFRDAKHIILISSCTKNNEWFQQDAITRQVNSQSYFEGLKIPYTIISTPILIKNRKHLDLKDLVLRVNDLNILKNISDKPAKTLIHKLKLGILDLDYFTQECLNNLEIVKNKSFEVVKRKDLGLPPLNENNLQGLISELKK